MNAQQVLVRGGAGVLGAALLAGAMWLHTVRPRAEARVLEPIRSEGRVGEVVANREFSVRVERVTAARALARAVPRRRTPPVRTDGVYVIVRARATSGREPVRLQTARLVTAKGNTYWKADRPDAAAPSEPILQPLLWSPVTWVFEVPRDQVAGARLLVGTGGLLPQLSAAAEIDLGLGGDVPVAALYDPGTER
ncbi:hypothetical protein [Actinomadura macrotermitis]|uniref:DUF4352 domain-containing protein n=1 Tax=Actinomadura macrotermitis TaxID=2585200 RepID=A0A7K0BTI3_9ACTN|nr:hypothetical protein [Actinomadura macrotermitis]MQY04461.1 hypothetical protein [Actinomadura macrotermitis]